MVGHESHAGLCQIIVELQGGIDFAQVRFLQGSDLFQDTHLVDGPCLVDHDLRSFRQSSDILRDFHFKGEDSGNPLGDGRD